MAQLERQRLHFHYHRAPNPLSAHGTPRKQKNTNGVAKAVIRLLKPFKSHVLSITTDNGGEFAMHKLVSKVLNVLVFFTDSYSFWQKGIVENTNKLIRQYLQK